LILKNEKATMKFQLHIAKFFVVLGLLSCVCAFAAEPPKITVTQSCPALLRFQFPKLQDESPQNLCQYAGKTLLVVNTASYCGFTSQYEGLEALYAQYAKRGLVILGFPSNDFSQEPGSSKQIADLCFNTYGVKFPMFAKTTVSGSGKNGFYAALEKATGKTPKWNFHKYLIAPDGRVVSSFASDVDPNNPKLIQALERLLP